MKLTFKKKIRLVVILNCFLMVFFSCSYVLSKEVDQFTDRLIQIRGLRDNLSVFNRYMNDHLIDLRNRLNARFVRSESEKWSLVESVFQSPLFAHLLNPIEEWISTSSSISRYVVMYRGIYGQDVDYDDMALLWTVGLSSVVRMGPVLIGTDKVGHFIGQGYEYYQRYFNLRKQGVSEELALADLRNQGDDLERRDLGLLTIGVYSYGDLAANWQGFQFYRQLFQGSNPYFQRTSSGEFQQMRNFDFSDYVVDDLDEVINPSALVSVTFFEKIKAHMRSGGSAGICGSYRSHPTEFMNRSETVGFPRLRRFDYVSERALSRNEPFLLNVFDLCSSSRR